MNLHTILMFQIAPGELRIVLREFPDMFSELA